MKDLESVIVRCTASIMFAILWHDPFWPSVIMFVLWCETLVSGIGRLIKECTTENRA